jgi:ankyrin repeat protein
MDSLTGKRSPKAIRMALRTLQKAAKHDNVKAIDQAYEQAMKRIEGQVADSHMLAKQVLSWITCARRPLTTWELRHALAVEMNESELDKNNLPDVEDMVSVCAGLVTIDEQSGIIRLVHYTAQEYFERTQDSWFPNAQNDITMTCVTYLSFDSFETGCCAGDKEFEERLKLNPLYDYAARNWGHHANVASQEVGPLILHFLDSAAQVSASSQATMARKFLSSHSGYSQQVPKGVGGVHICAYFGLEKVMTVLLNNSHNRYLKDAHDRTPLSWAAEHGHELVVKLLLSMGDTDSNSPDPKGWTPLFLAASRAHKSVVKLLLDTDCINTHIKSKSSQPIPTLDAYSHAILLSNMLEAVHNVVQDRMAIEGQMLGIGERYWLLMKRLIEKYHIGLNKKDEWGMTILSHAAAGRFGTVVKLLLLTDIVDINPKDKYGRTPLWWAKKLGRTTVERLLVEKYGENGIDIHDDEITIPTTPAPPRRCRIWCDVCISLIPNDNIHYHCEICSLGDFDLCQKCVLSGALCLDHSHKLIKRTVKDGDFVGLPD